MLYRQRENFLRPFAGGHHKLSMAMEEIGPETWIEIDGSHAESMQTKRGLIESNHADIFAAQEQAYDSCQELLAFLMDNLLRHHSSVFQQRDGRLTDCISKQSWDRSQSSLHPLDLAGRLVTEDFCLHLPVGDSYCLAAATLCSPSGWRLAGKIGLALDELHGPVPDYQQRLAAGVKGFFSRIQPGRFYSRVIPNWGLFTSPKPFQPARVAAPEPITAVNAGRSIWLRSEKHVFHRLPETKAVVFTIRVISSPLNEVVRSRQDADALADTVRSMSQPTLDYKDITPHADALLQWLERFGT